jgi:hypothetical protein
MSLTVVRHRVNRGLFAVVGTGHAQSASATPSFFLGDLVPDVKREECSVVVVCDRHGTLGVFAIQDVEVMLVGGVTPSQAVADALERFGEPPAAGRSDSRD